MPPKEYAGLDLEPVNDQSNLKFEKAAAFTFRPDIEGGYVVDGGGPTNYGTTQTTLDAYQKSRGLPPLNVKDITQEYSKKIAREEYFDKPKLDAFPDNTASLVFDFGYNASPARAIKIVQSIVGAKADGINGPKTQAAVKKHIEQFGEQDLNQKISDKIKDYYIGITEGEDPTIRRNGYMNRIQKQKKRLNLSFLNPFHTPDASADEVPSQFPDLDLTPVDQNSTEELDLELVKPSKPASNDFMGQIGHTLGQAAEYVRGLGIDRKLYDAALAQDKRAIENMSERDLISFYGTTDKAEAFAQQKEVTDSVIASSASSMDKLFFKLPSMAAKATGVDTGVVKELQDKNKTSTDVGGAVGDLGSLLGVGAVLNATKLPGVATKVGQAGSKYWAASTRFLPRAIMTSSVFGAHTGLNEVVQQAKDGKFDPLELGQKVIESAGLGGAIGAVGGINNVPLAVVSAAGIGANYAKAQGADDVDALLNGAVFGIFELVGGFARDVKLRAEAVNFIKNSMTDWALKKNPGMNPNDARVLSERFVAETAAEAGGMERILKSQENTLSYLEDVNKRIQTAIAKPEAVKAKTADKPAEIAAPAQQPAKASEINKKASEPSKPKETQPGAFSQGKQGLVEGFPEVFPADKAMNKTIADLDQRWNAQRTALEKEQVPLNQQLSDFQEQLSNLKGNKGKEAAFKRKELTEKISDIQGMISQGEVAVEQENLEFQEKVMAMATRMAGENGVQLSGGDELENFQTGLSEWIFSDRGYREGFDKAGVSNYQRPLKDIIQEYIKEFKGSPLGNERWHKANAEQMATVPGEPIEFLDVANVEDPVGTAKRVISVTEEGKYYVSRPDGTYLYNSDTESALFDDIEAAKEAAEDDVANEPNLLPSQKERINALKKGDIIVKADDFPKDIAGGLENDVEVSQDSIDNKRWSVAMSKNRKPNKAESDKFRLALEEKTGIPWKVDSISKFVFHAQFGDQRSAKDLKPAPKEEPIVRTPSQKIPSSKNVGRESSKLKPTKKQKADAHTIKSPEAIQREKDMGVEGLEIPESKRPENLSDYWSRYETMYKGYRIHTAIRKSDGGFGAAMSSPWDVSKGEGDNEESYRVPNFDTLDEVKNWIDRDLVNEQSPTILVLSDITRATTDELNDLVEYFSKLEKLSHKEAAVLEAAKNQLEIHEELGVDGPDEDSRDFEDGGTERLPVKLTERTAYLADGSELRRTPPGQPTVDKIIKKGMFVTGTGGEKPYLVVSVREFRRHGLPTYSLRLLDLDKKGDAEAGMNDLVAQDGIVQDIRYDDQWGPVKILSELEAIKLFVANGGEEGKIINLKLPKKYLKEEFIPPEFDDIQEYTEALNEFIDSKKSDEKALAVVDAISSTEDWNNRIKFIQESPTNANIMEFLGDELGTFGGSGNWNWKGGKSPEVNIGLVKGKTTIKGDELVNYVKEILKFLPKDNITLKKNGEEKLDLIPIESPETSPKAPGPKKSKGKKGKKEEAPEASKVLETLAEHAREFDTFQEFANSIAKRGNFLASMNFKGTDPNEFRKLLSTEETIQKLDKTLEQYGFVSAEEFFEQVNQKKLDELNEPDIAEADQMRSNQYEASFKDTRTDKIINTGSFHDISKLSKLQQKIMDDEELNNITNEKRVIVDGFTDKKTGEFFTREELQSKFDEEFNKKNKIPIVGVERVSKEALDKFIESGKLKSEKKEGTTDVQRDQTDTGTVRGDDVRGGSRSGGFSAVESGREPQDAGPRPISPSETPETIPGNYKITDADAIGEGGLKTKFKQNISAIKLLKKIELESRKATPEEQKQLVKYVGWGGLSQAFDRYNSEWSKEQRELNDLLSSEEYSDARASTVSAYYTSPELIKAMWGAVTKMGFKRGKVLDPSAGVGHFVGLAPQAGKSFSMVELDSLTGRIAAQLYQGSNVQVKGLQEAALPVNFFDLVISNIPFADYKPYDAKAKALGIPGQLMLHDYFFAKAIAHTKPGGIVAFITSKGTLDKGDKTLREYLNNNAKLLGAFRLPQTAFKKNANTEVVTDIIFLQKLKPGEVANNPDFIGTGELKIGSKRVDINNYFLANKQNVLGKLAIESGLYNDSELVVKEEGMFNDRLATVMESLPKDIYGVNAKDAEDITVGETIEDHNQTKPFAYVIQDGKLYQKLEGQLVAQPVSANDMARISGIIDIRDTVRDLLSAERKNYTDEQLKLIRRELNRQYDGFVKKFGYLNENKNVDIFSDDPDSPLVSSLENVIKIKKGVYKYEKQPIFTTRIIKPHVKPTKAAGLKDALNISLGEYGQPNMKYIAELIGQTEAGVEKQMLAEGLVFRDPNGEAIVLADEYLSGNVKRKLVEAQEAVKIDERYKDNIKALEAVQPKDLTFDQIHARIGMPWIKHDIYQQFLREIGVDGIKIFHNSATGSWEKERVGWSYSSGMGMFGTERMDAAEVFIRVANGKPLKVFDKRKDPEGKEYQVLNEEQTALAEQKGELMKEKFGQWFWADDTRRAENVRYYNDNWNTDVVRKYNGDHLVFPGMNINAFPNGLRKTQKDAIWRGITTNRLMLAHSVGAGKTAIMTIIAMESKRLGLTNKTMITAPKNTIPGWRNQINSLYPAAKVLIANEKNFDSTKRKSFLSKIATGDWDMVVIPETSFQRMQVSPEAYEEYVSKEIAELREAKEELRAAGARLSVKNIEKALLKKEEKLKEILDQSKRDDVLAFEELGVDSIYVDEADKFKNLSYFTQKQGIKGMGSPEGSDKATDMMMKADIIRKGAGKLIFATGTPISNSMVEAYTMMKYLQPEILNEKGIRSFDDWSNTFGEIDTRSEVDVTGGKYKIVSRFSRFVNVAELMKMIRTVWDIQTQDMLEAQGILVKGKNLPLIKGGKPEPVIVPVYPALQDYTAILIDRAKKIEERHGRVEKGDDILLTVLSDGKKAAIDIRTIDPTLTPPDSKVEHTIRGVLDVYKRYASVKGTQLIFIDRMAPDKTAQWNPHYYMRKKLVAGGIPDAQIAFIHDYPKDEQKDELYEKMNNGDIRVLFGSTEKLGAGTNIQERLAALWHLDVPWRPRDITQREGRIVRPGNINKTVEIYRMAQKGSLDTFMYNLLEAKAKSIEQLLQGGDQRLVEEGDVNEYEQLKALSSENPLVKEKADLDRSIRGIKALYNAHLTERTKAQEIVQEVPEQIKFFKSNLAVLENFVSNRPERFTKENFTVKVGQDTFNDKEKALEAIWKASGTVGIRENLAIQIGEYAGYPLVLSKEVAQDKVVNNVGIELAKNPQQITLMGKISQDPTGSFVSIDNAIWGGMAANDIEYYRKKISAGEKDLAYSQDLLTKDFSKQKELDEKIQRQAIVNQELLKASVKKEVPQEPPASDAAGKASKISTNIDNFEKSASQDLTRKEAFKLSERIVPLVKKYAVRFGENYNPSGTEGFFFSGTDNIFVRAKNNITAAVHEVTHYLDKKVGFTKRLMKPTGTTSAGKPIYDNAFKDVRGELTDIYTKYYPEGKKDHPLLKRVEEGTAMFFERMVSHPILTKEEYPILYKEFLSRGGRFSIPIMSEFVNEFRAIVDDYQRLSDLDKVKARMVDVPVMENKPFLNIQETAIYKNIDNKYPLEKLAKEAGQHFTKQDPSLIARIYDHVPMVVQHNLSDAAFVGIGPWGFGKETYLTLQANGEVAKLYDFNWHTLVNRIGYDIEDFNGWLIARRVINDFKNMERLKAIAEAKAEELKAAQGGASNLDEANQSLADIFDAGDDLVKEEQQAREAFERAQRIVENNKFDFGVAKNAYLEHRDRFAQHVGMFDKLVRADLDLARTAGFIKDEAYEEMIKEEGYASFKREIENEIIGTGEGVDAAPRSINIGGKKVSSLMRYGGSGKDIISPLYSSMVNHQEIMKKASKQMVYNAVADLANKFPGTFQQLPLKRLKDNTGKIVYPQDRDPNIMMAFENGKRIPYLVNKDLKTMIDTILTPANVGLTEKIFVGLAQAFTKGTTAFYLPFSATNFVIDQLSAATNSWTKYIPVYTPVAELVKTLSNLDSPQAKYAMEYFMLGGERQAYLSFADLNPREAYEFIKNEKKAIDHALDILNAGGDILAVPVKATELLTRMSEFTRARTEGYSQLAALELAGRISTPFHHRGQKGDIYRFITRSIPYLNASVQVLAQEARAIKHEKTRNRALMMMAMITTAMVAGIATVLKSTDEQKQLLKGLSVDKLARYIFLPHPDGEKLIKIRVPQEKGTFGTIFNMALMDAQLDAKYSFYEYLRAATAWVPDQYNPIDLGRWMASWIPQAISPVLQVAFNKRIYPKIRDLEPDYMKYLPKDERVFETSSKAARWLGPKFGLSPIQFDALVEGYTGRSIRYVTGREIGNPFEEKMYLTASRQLINFYALRAQNDEKFQQLKNKTRTFTPEEARSVQNLHARISVIEEEIKKYRKVTKENKNAPELKAIRTRILNEVDSL